MKRISILSALLLALFVLIPVRTSGQARLNTKKINIADFGARTTKVVLGGSGMTDTALKEAVSAGWRISPFEFCSGEEYLQLKDDPDQYFLLLARSDEAKYRGILTLTLMKGGKYGTDDTTNRPVDIASLPFRASEFPSGREMVMLPALLDIIQDYASKALVSDKAGYKGFDIYSRNGRRDGRRILFSEGDVDPGMLEIISSTKEVFVVEEDEADQAMYEGAPDTMVSFVVAPFSPEKGSRCYKMVIDTRSHELYYFSHHRIGAGKWAGFLKKDIRKVSAKH